ncbi:BTAD domain-containing putative transcriptional regulator [Nocardia sp. NPDC051321]|uniref:BTAD domain-containing putative transcriptional regulator n=1 Tax=Nocardia sp. NPDC051321 TaxID=3364323 RepID=UPI00379D56A6
MSRHRYPDDVLSCRILGPVVVGIDGTVVDLGGPTGRRMLAALSFGDGAPVSDSRLAELVWGDDQPQHMAKALSVVISRLRLALGPIGRRYLERTTAGYALVIPPDWTDRGQFVAAVETGLRQLAEDDAASAVPTLESALTLWRGDPWFELGDSVALAGARAKLAELREVAVEELQAARLACGDIAGAVASLSEAVTEAPYRERRWELLALGLYRSGRQSQALAELRRVRELLINELGIEPGPVLRSLEQHMLAHEPRLLAVGSPKPPPARSESVPPAVTKPLSTLIGRSRELQRLAESVAESRMVTLLGPAGVGKTRLAVEHAANSDREVWFVRLADVRTAEAVVAATAEAVGVVHLDDAPTAQLRRVLENRTGLMIFDNCEHVVDAAAQLVLPLLNGCPGLRILTTSRRVLGVDGEHIMSLDPLPIVDEHGGDGAAVELFLDRVRSNRARCDLAPVELDAIREICGLLDGLPLAIELAASRARAFGPRDIRTHLRDRLDVLGATPLGSISPHASLTAAISWSVDRLAPADRAFLLRLWPFEGGFTWQAAMAVQPPEHRDRAVLAVLAALVDCSVIGADVTTRPTRYRMLETVRRYCHDIDQDPAATEAAHAAWVRRLIAGFVAEGPFLRVGAAFPGLSAELPNIRAGIEYDIEHDPIAAMWTASSVEWVEMGVDALPGGKHLLETALTACPSSAVVARARGLIALSSICFERGYSAEAVRFADMAIVELGDDPAGDEAGRVLLVALLRRVGGALVLRDARLARATIDWFKAESADRSVDPWMKASAMLCEGSTLLLERKQADGEAMLGAAREYAAKCGFTWVQGTADVVLARNLLRADPDPALARTALLAIERAWAVFADRGNPFDLLGVIYAGAHALATLQVREPAIALRAWVIDQAIRIGDDPQRYAHLAGDEGEELMRRLLQEQQGSPAERMGRASTSAELHQMFIDAVRSVC